MSTSSKPQTILVTGAGGYLGSWIVKSLLLDGHTVHGTVRKAPDPDKLAHLHELERLAPGRLQLFDADLLQAGGFREAMRGCRVVIHTASPYFLAKCDDPAEQLVRPAVEGTRNVLAAVNDEPSVERVVLTSSIVAMFGSARELCRGTGILQETGVNRTSTISNNPYALSKALAEQAAQDIHARQSRWGLVSIHPGAIFGPALSTRTEATSVGMMRQFLDGSFRGGVPRLSLGLVDVRDVALAHVRAALCSGATGRYIAVAESLTLLQIARLIRAAFPSHARKLPQWEIPKELMWLVAPFAGMTREYVAANVNHVVGFNASRSRKDLSIDYRSPGSTLHDHVRQLAADGLLPA